MALDAPLPWPTIVFLADVYDAGASNAPMHLRRDLEQTDPDTLREILEALERLGPEVRHFKDPRELIAALPGLKSPIVLSTYGGPPSRNRLILAPALAETLGFDFVGMDATGQALAHQKENAKRVAAEHGLITPAWRVLRDEEDLDLCFDFPTPYVLKPLAEGSSIGISQDNLIREPARGVTVARELLQQFSQPVLMEEFAAGREVSLVAIQSHSAMHEAFVEVAVDGDPDYFATHLFDADEKYHRRLPRRIALIDDALADVDRTAIHSLLRGVGRFGYVRVDGKLVDGRFTFLELTPDAWLGKRGHVAAGFMAKGWSYAEVLKAILLSASPNIPSQCSSG